MNIEEVRTSFTVYVIASRLAQLGGIAEVLGKAGYIVASFTELTAAFSELYSNPPHFVIFDAQESHFDLAKAIGQVTSQLPESHVFMMTKAEERQKTAAWLEKGVYDLILLPPAAPFEFVRAVDRAAERDYFMYLNERLMEDREPVTKGGADDEAPAKESAPAMGEDFHLEYARKLFEQENIEDAIKVFMSSASSVLAGCSAIYFKYIPNRRVLLAGLGEKLDDFDLRGLGMNFNESVEDFRSVQLREPMRLAPFVQMVKDVFSVKDFFCFPVRALGEIQGLVCFLTAPPPSAAMTDLMQEWVTLLEKAISLNEAEKRLHVVSVRDPATDLLNRQAFLTKVNEEVSRSRRTHLATSLILIVVDQFGQLTSRYGQDEAHLVLKTIGKILEKHSRINDIVGRIGVDEFGLILPHTGKQGAMIKAERLRLIVESADFTKVLNRFPKLTVSLGVSEYPGLVRDAEELVQSADEALFEVRKGGNKTCVAKAPEDFEPDFKVREAAPAADRR